MWDEDKVIGKIEEFAAFLIVIIIVSLFLGFVACAIFVIYHVSPIISFIVGVVGEIIISKICSWFWRHKILEED